MKVQFIKRNKFSKDDDDFYVITTLLNDKTIGVSYVSKKTYQWFDNVECGEEIPTEFTTMDLYESKGKLNAKLEIDIK